MGPKRQAEIGKELRTAATWVGGPRRAKLLELALELEGVDKDNVEDEAATLAAELDQPTPHDPETGLPPSSE